MVGATSGDGRGRGTFYRYGHLAVHKFREERAMEAVLLSMSTFKLKFVDGITASSD